jgi:16S rRNA (adenine1518-N6/adenine1519-N6)-dimethyltransferase
MKYAKKSLGQNFLSDPNIIKKIINLTEINNRNIVEIGPGKGALTEEILKRQPKSLLLIEKDFNLAIKLKKKYLNNKIVKIKNADILKFDLKNFNIRNQAIFGNLPYNISSQILVKFLQFKKWPPKYSDLIFMFQKELGEKIIGNFSTKHYGRLSILTNYRLNVLKKFLVSPNCFFPKPKITSMVIQFQPKKRELYHIKNIINLEKITNIIFSNRRKMINKSIKKILSPEEIKRITDLKLNFRASEIKPEIYYRITEIYENK